MNTIQSSSPLLNLPTIPFLNIFNNLKINDLLTLRKVSKYFTENKSKLNIHWHHICKIHEWTVDDYDSNKNWYSVYAVKIAEGRLKTAAKHKQLILTQCICAKPYLYEGLFVDGPVIYTQRGQLLEKYDCQKKTLSGIGNVNVLNSKQQKNKKENALSLDGLKEQINVITPATFNKTTSTIKANKEFTPDMRSLLGFKGTYSSDIVTKEGIFLCLAKGTWGNEDTSIQTRIVRLDLETNNAYSWNYEFVAEPLAFTTFGALVVSIPWNLYNCHSPTLLLWSPDLTEPVGKIVPVTIGSINEIYIDKDKIVVQSREYMEIFEIRGKDTKAFSWEDRPVITHNEPPPKKCVLF